jgi:pimeloyl-ACP methyl ester carboxylesterase
MGTTRREKYWFAALIAPAILGMAFAVAANDRAFYQPKFERKACVGKSASAGFRCGTVRVPEDWTVPNGRHIALNVLIIPGRARTSNPIPMFFLAGGPGVAATGYAPFYLGENAQYRELGDVVLFDMRGTGQSGSLHCPYAEPPVTKIDSAYENPYRVAIMRECATRLSQRASLTQYNTPTAVEDLDAVRIALGYNEINLRGHSYGTEYALAYIHEHPNHVHAAVLESVAPPINLSSTTFGLAAQRGLDALMDRCRAIAACHAKYPDPVGDIRKILADIARKGGFSARGGTPPKSLWFKITGAQFMEELRGPLSVSSMARSIPKMLHEAAAGNYQTFVDLTLPGKLAHSDFPRGLFFSVNCTGDYMHVNSEAIAAEDRRTLFGHYKFRTQQDVCDVWPKSKLPDAFYADFASPVPTLFLSGDLDPVTPPEWAATLARRFVHGRQVIVSGMGHVPATAGEIGCIATLETHFLARPDSDAVDTSCARDLSFQPFD